MKLITEFVGVILEDSQGRIALQLRDQDQRPNPDKWSVFGGHIEEGEDSAQAAAREIREELTVSLSLEKLNSLGRHERSDQAYTIYHYRVSDELDEAQLKEGVAWRWCSQDEIEGGMVEGKPVVDYHARFLIQFLSSRK